MSWAFFGGKGYVKDVRLIKEENRKFQSGRDSLSLFCLRHNSTLKFPNLDSSLSKSLKFQGVKS